MERPDVEPQRFPEIGFTLAVLEPGKPSGMYHAESGQEDFLVLSGTCLLLIEAQSGRSGPGTSSTRPGRQKRSAYAKR